MFLNKSRLFRQFYHLGLLRNLRAFGKETINLGSIGESVTEATVKQFDKNVGDWVDMDEIVITLESAKNDAEVRTTTAGVITKFLVEMDQDVEVGNPLFEVDSDAKKPEQGSQKEAPVQETPKEDKATVSQPQKDTQSKVEAPKSTTPTPPPPPTQTPASKQPAAKKPQPVPASPSTASIFQTGFVGHRTEKREKMTRFRRTVSENLKKGQNTNATVTTFNEIDMHATMAIRKELGEKFLKEKGIKLGFMSFFIKACAQALVERPIVNARIDDKTNEIVFRSYVDISIAVSGPRGQMVPVMRNVEKMTFSDIEETIISLATKARNNKLAIEDLSGGTFSISNGGIFGSMLSAPILSGDLSAIMGMHNIVNRPVVRNGQIVSRPIMYTSVSYDHRLLDGREGAGFLKRVCDLVSDPRMLLLEL